MGNRGKGVRVESLEDGVGKDKDNERTGEEERTEVQGKDERGLLLGEIVKGAG